MLLSTDIYSLVSSFMGPEDVRRFGQTNRAIRQSVQYLWDQIFLTIRGHARTCHVLLPSMVRNAIVNSISQRTVAVVRGYFGADLHNIELDEIRNRIQRIRDCGDQAVPLLTLKLDGFLTEESKTFLLSIFKADSEEMLDKLFKDPAWRKLLRENKVLLVGSLLLTHDAVRCLKWLLQLDFSEESFFTTTNDLAYYASRKAYKQHRIQCFIELEERRGGLVRFVRGKLGREDNKEEFQSMRKRFEEPTQEQMRGLVAKGMTFFKNTLNKIKK